MCMILRVSSTYVTSLPGEAFRTVALVASPVGEVAAGGLVEAGARVAGVQAVLAVGAGEALHALTPVRVHLVYTAPIVQARTGQNRQGGIEIYCVLCYVFYF